MSIHVHLYFNIDLHVVLGLLLRLHEKKLVYLYHHGGLFEKKNNNKNKKLSYCNGSVTLDCPLL